MSNQVKGASSNSKTEQQSNLSAFCQEECVEQQEDFQQLMEDVGQSLTTYCKKRPMVAALAVFMTGFYMGWKIKPW